MRVQFGLLNLGGRPVTPDDFTKVAGEYGSYPAEIVGETSDGPLLMAYRGDRITYEEDFEVQPFRLGGLLLTWDGRLDNREEIASKARLNHIERLSDPEIVLRAYRTCGDPIFDELIGEFSLVVWNNDTRRLKFARSGCGARTLYYVLTKDALTWSTDFAHLVRVAGVDLKVNDEYVFDYFVSEPDTKQTALAAVQASPPNHVLTFENGGASQKRELWDPTKIKPLRYRTDEEYEEACREQVRNAVRVRLRSKFPIFAELSGGLDSSTIVVTADDILRQRTQSESSLHTVSCVYNQSETCDEYGFISPVVEQCALETHLVSERDQRITLGLEERPPFTGQPNPLHCLPGRYETFSKIMRDQGARVLLTGIGGDHLFWSEPDGAPIVADEIRRAHLIRAHRECTTWSRVVCLPYYRVSRQALRLLVASLFPGDGMYKSPQVPPWICSSDHGKSLSPPVDFGGYKTWFAAPTRRAQVFLADRLFRLTGSGFMNEYQQLYISHPFSHRPLIEFCLGTPVAQFLRNGKTRSLLRRAFLGLLPRKTVKRVSKGLVDETLLRAVRSEWQSLGDPKRWQVCERGYVNCDELQKSLNRARQGFLDFSGPLLHLFSIERWLRSLAQVSTDFRREFVHDAIFTSSHLRFRSYRQTPEKV